MRLINADALVDSFELSDFNDNCFENYDNVIRIINSTPTIPLVYCRDCKHRPTIEHRIKENRSYFKIEFPDYKCPCQCEDGYYSWYPEDNWFCANGEPKDE